MKQALTNLISIFLWLTAALPPASAAAHTEKSDAAERLIKEAYKYLYNNPKQASWCATQAHTLFAQDNAPNEARARALLLHCHAEQLLGNFDLSLNKLYETEKLIAPDNRRLLAQLHSLMGRVYGKLGGYRESIRFNDQATAAFKALGDSASVAVCYNERGVTHHFMGEYDVADRFFRRALAINRSLRNLKEIAANLNNLCLYKGDTDEKLALIREAITINKNLDAQWALGENYNNMGRQYFYGKQYKQALEALQKAYGYAHSIKANELIRDNYEYSSWVYAAMGNYGQAYNYLKEMQRLEQKLLSTNRLRNIEQEIAYKQYQDQRHAIEMQEQLHQEELLKRNLRMAVSLLVIGIVFGIILYKWYKRRKGLQLMEARYRLEQSEREVSELKLRQQEQELHNLQDRLTSSRNEATNFAVFLKSRNELLEKIREMIKEGYRMEHATIAPHLKTINAFIAQHLSNEKTDNPLMNDIEKKSEEFIERLTALHPNLTASEKHLATLLRVNLGTKEIAMLTGTTAKTVNMNRYRLRKSLGLDNEVDLTEYLRGIS